MALRNLHEAQAQAQCLGRPVATLKLRCDRTFLGLCRELMTSTVSRQTSHDGQTLNPEWTDWQRHIHAAAMPRDRTFLGYCRELMTSTVL